VVNIDSHFMLEGRISESDLRRALEMSRH
jgi:hypothetical protein